MHLHSTRHRPHPACHFAHSFAAAVLALGAWEAVAVRAWGAPAPEGWIGLVIHVAVVTAFFASANAVHAARRPARITPAHAEALTAAVGDIALVFVVGVYTAVLARAVTGGFTGAHAALVTVASLLVVAVVALDVWAHQRAVRTA